MKVPLPLYLIPPRFLIKFSLVVNWLNTHCVSEKFRPPMDQLIWTWPLYSLSSSFWANILVNSLTYSTRIPGGDSCKAMVSEVSMVKNSLMGHSIIPARGENVCRQKCKHLNCLCFTRCKMTNVIYAVVESNKEHLLSLCTVLKYNVMVLLLEYFF